MNFLNATAHCIQYTVYQLKIHEYVPHIPSFRIPRTLKFSHVQIYLIVYFMNRLFIDFMLFSTLWWDLMNWTIHIPHTETLLHFLYATEQVTPLRFYDKWSLRCRKSAFGLAYWLFYCRCFTFSFLTINQIVERKTNICEMQNRKFFWQFEFARNVEMIIMEC